MSLAAPLAACGDDDEKGSDAATDLSTDAQDTSDTADQTTACSTTLRADADLVAATHKSVVAAGTFANTITIEDDYAYIVNSGDNAVQRYNVTDPAGTSEAAFVDVGADKNPFDLAVYGSRIYITNSMEGSISVADLDGNLLGTTVLPELVGPQDIVATESYLLVANTEFTFPVPSGHFGSLVVLARTDAPTLVNRVETTQSNPQFVRVVGDTVYVINSGATDYDMSSGLVTPTTDGGVDVFTLSTIGTATAPERNVALPPSGLVGNPGHPAIAGSTMYLGSGTAAALFAVDLTSMTVLHGASDPLVITETAGANGLVIPFEGPGGLLTVLDFNGDALRFFDPSCDQVVGDAVELGSSAELLEGPFDLAWADGDVAHIVLSVSSSVATFDAGAVLTAP